MATNLELIEGISTSSKSITSKASALKTQVTALEALKVSQANEIAALKAEIVILKATIETLEARIAELEAGTTPPPSVWPNASNTGPTGTLISSGDIETSAPGQVIENKNITGFVNLRHNGCILRNCQVSGNVFVTADDCIVEDTEVILSGWNSAISVHDGADRATIRRCDISNFENGIVFGSGSGHTVRDSYFHDPLDYRLPSQPHIDGIQFHGGTGHDSLIEHNNLDLYPEVSSSITMGNQTPGQGARNNTINNNRLSGGTAVIYVEGSDSSGVRITNNLMGNSIFNTYVSGSGRGTVFYSGNTDIVTGAPLNL